MVGNNRNDVDYQYGNDQGVNSSVRHFGNPETIVSDNGRQFASREFAELYNENGVAQVRSPPFHPQSNGQAERFVNTFKRALQKLKDSDTMSEVLQKFSQVYRRTPCSASPDVRSPTENFIGRSTGPHSLC
ncbi:hypothetical protein OESDEN_00855 [Oesophagostomum dentatum]|uniref:Integrase catalytic domain-containing protein n=1 Tax=Oesophagostomum dentatum TaxID=61180 RepID=A0A0B1TTM2_OESDE|nr:hypothetical protein OESDEN_00855 [Oesophagostomum dentatum]